MTMRALALHADLHDISVALGSQQSTAFAFALQKGVGGDGRSHADRLDGVQAELLAFGDLFPSDNL